MDQVHSRHRQVDLGARFSDEDQDRWRARPGKATEGPEDTGPEMSPEGPCGRGPHGAACARAHGSSVSCSVRGRGGEGGHGARGASRGVPGWAGGRQGAAVGRGPCSGGGGSGLREALGVLGPSTGLGPRPPAGQTICLAHPRVHLLSCLFNFILKNHTFFFCAVSRLSVRFGCSDFDTV